MALGNSVDEVVANLEFPPPEPEPQAEPELITAPPGEVWRQLPLAIPEIAKVVEVALVVVELVAVKF